MLFGRYCASGLFYGFQDRFGIQRLDGVDVDHLSTNAFLAEHGFCYDSFPYQMACSENRYIAAINHFPSFTDLKFLICRRKYRPAWSSKAEVYGAFKFCNRKGSSLGLIVVARVDHRHVGKHFHHAQIFQDLVGCTIFSQSQSGV